MENVIDLLEYIQQIMPKNGEILVRTNGKSQWFVHYLINLSKVCRQSIYKVYTENLTAELLKVISIIKEEGENNE